MAEEIFDVVDDFDEIIGQEKRGEVHRRGLNHRAVQVLVFNSRGEVFLQKRSTNKECFPGAWDSSASGHLSVGETYDACSVRELEEELGLKLDQPPARLFKIDACPQTGNEFIWIYRCKAEGPFRLHPDEIESGDWFAFDFVKDWIARSPSDFAGAVLLIWPLLERS
jgi:isopentenyldiphosphate isomerase